MNRVEFRASRLLLGSLIQTLELGHGTESRLCFLLFTLVERADEGEAVLVVVVVHVRLAVVSGNNEAVLGDEHARLVGKVLSPDGGHSVGDLVEHTHSGVVSHPGKLVTGWGEGHIMDPASCVDWRKDKDISCSHL